MSHYDAIVLGTGGVGSAALMHLARRGARVVGIDRFHPPHDRGSSHGHTRVIRQAYFEHQDYVPLVLESYRLWAELEQLVDQRLFHQIGLLQAGPADGIVVPGVLRAAAAHRLAVDSLAANDVRARWPGIAMADELAAVYEEHAGYLLVDDCVRAHLEVARRLGAELRTNCQVTSWFAEPGRVVVQTDAGPLIADRLVVSAGAWAAQILATLQQELSVRRKSLFWFRNHEPNYTVAGGLPVFLFELPHGIFYGFPQLDPTGVKVGEHTGGEIVNDPLSVDRSQRSEERDRLRSFLAAHLPGVTSEVIDHSVCLYTMTCDENFVVGQHPEHAQVCFAAGLSGHGFKFAAVLGKALAELVLDGQTDLPIGFLSPKRLADPDRRLRS